jgi:transcriptional regulator with XRE-family HTH domain
MTKEELKKNLKKMGMTKRQLAELLGLSYSTVNNWGNSKNIPRWMESWMTLYLEAKEYRELRKRMVAAGICQDLIIHQ